MKYELVTKVNEEEEVAMAKWGATDRTPEILLNAVTEELGEVAHAINHNEGLENICQEIVETIGILSRLYNMITGGEKYGNRTTDQDTKR